MAKIDLANLSDDELINLKVEVDDVMRKRGLAISVGDIGEQLAINYFNSTSGLPNLIEALKGAKNVDALSRDGERYSIKTQQRAKKTGKIYPDKDDPEKQLFEYLLVVKLNETYGLKSIHRFSWNDFVSVRAWDKRMNAWYIPISKKKLNAAEQIYMEM